MIKRIISIFLAVLMLLTVLSGCGLKKKLTAFQLYMGAADAIRKAGGMEAECSALFDVGIISLSMDMHIKQNGKDSEFTVLMGGEQVSKTTTVGGTVYSESAAGKFCYPVPEGSGRTDFSGVPALAKELFDNIEIFETDDGGSEITVSIGVDTINSMLGDAGNSLDFLRYDNAVLTMYFDADDNITSMYLTCDADISSAGITMSVEMTIEYRFINLGTAPEIAVPDDADEYVLTDAPAA